MQIGASRYTPRPKRQRPLLRRLSGRWRAGCAPVQGTGVDSHPRLGSDQDAGPPFRPESLPMPQSSVHYRRIRRALACTGLVIAAACSDDNTVSGPPSFTPTPVVTADQLKTALDPAVGNPAAGNGGLNLNMWATVVDRSGIVVAVVFTGAEGGDQWPGSRIISAQKANTANNVQPRRPGALDRQPLFRGPAGRQPVRAAGSQPGRHGRRLRRNATDSAPPRSMVGQAHRRDQRLRRRLRAVRRATALVGGMGVSGDTSCADHAIGWKVRFPSTSTTCPAA